MAQSPLTPGTVLRLRSLRHYHEDGFSYHDWKIGPPPGKKSPPNSPKKVAVVLLLGSEDLVLGEDPALGEELDLEKAMRSLGWERIRGKTG
jgi:hypothetical protein